MGLTGGVSKNTGYIDRLYGRVDAVYIDFGVLDYHRVVVSGKTLTVSCAAETDTREYTVRGIARRPWVKHWTLGEWTRVESARLRNGVLEVELVTETPGAPTPREIPVARS